MIDLRRAAYLLGGEASGRDQVVCPGPGHGPRDRSLSVLFDHAAPGGFVVHTFSPRDDPIACRDYVRERLRLPAWQPGDDQDRRVPRWRLREHDRQWVDQQAEQRRPRTEDDMVRIQRAQAIWNEAQHPGGTVAEQYLPSRALELPDDLAGTVLRFHPRCPWRNEDTGRMDHIPALIAAFRSIDDDTITAIHRIRLDQPERWPKADRKMLGPVLRAAVKLDAAGSTLAIGEGIETCMAARQLGYRPAWALGSVGGISFFPVLTGIKHLLILAEKGAASAEAVQFCGRRWHRAGRRVQIVTPDI